MILATAGACAQQQQLETTKHQPASSNCMLLLYPIDKHPAI
jgi:hypothetical protein